MYKLQLSYWLKDCPPCWKNFADTLKYHVDTAVDIDEEIKKYNGIFFGVAHHPGDDTYVLFENEEDAMAFKLRFA